MSKTSIDPTSIVSAALKAYGNATGTPGLAAAVIYNGQDYFIPWGHANAKLKTLITKSTVFEIGSITKVFTATILAYNVANIGTFSLSDPVTKYLPYTFDPNAAINNVTLGQLATHTSGMPDQAGGSEPSENLFQGNPPSSDLIAYWQSFAPAANITLPCWTYSNIGFVTLGFAIGGCSPNNYNSLLSSYILDQLSMTQTGSNNPPGLRVAQGYVGPLPPGKNHLAPSEAWDLKSTPGDMTLFLQANMEPTHDTIGNALNYSHNPIFSGSNCESKAPLKFEMGLAWQISQMTSKGGQNYMLAAKDGATSKGGFTSWIGFIPENMGIVLLSNKLVKHKAPPHSPPPPPIPKLTDVGRGILQSLLDANP